MTGHGRKTMSEIYIESMDDAIERNRGQMAEVKARLEKAGVKYLLCSWIDLLGVPKTKPVSTARLP